MSYCFECRIPVTNEISRKFIKIEPDLQYMLHGEPHIHMSSYTSIVWKCPNGHTFTNNQQQIRPSCGPNH